MVHFSAASLVYFYSALDIGADDARLLREEQTVEALFEPSVGVLDQSRAQRFQGESTSMLRQGEGRQADSASRS